LFGRNKKKKQNKGKDIEQVSSTKIEVKVFSALGGDLRTLKATYSAIELRNDFSELVSINDKFKHDEDVNFHMDSIYREMQVLLDFRSKSKAEKQTSLNQKVQKQEKLIFFLDRVPELNAFYNYQDEWAKLRDLRVLRNYLRLDDHGSYFYIENGVRTYEFDSVDGFLIPRWHGNDTYSSYPDHTRTKKIKIQEDYIFQKEMASRRFDMKLMSYAAIFFAVNMVLLAGMGVGAYFAFDKIQNIDNEAILASQACMENSQQLNEQFGQVIKDTFDFRRKMLVQDTDLGQQTIESEKAEKPGLIERILNK